VSYKCWLLIYFTMFAYFTCLSCSSTWKNVSNLIVFICIEHKTNINMKISGFRYDMNFAVLPSSSVGFSPCKPKLFTVALICMIFQHGIKHIYENVKMSYKKWLPWIISWFCWMHRIKTNLILLVIIQPCLIYISNCLITVMVPL